jgi:hypothetical protein
LINSAGDPVTIKQEILDEYQQQQQEFELMDLDDPDNFLEILTSGPGAGMDNSFGDSEEDGSGNEGAGRGNKVVYVDGRGEEGEGEGEEDEDGDGGEEEEEVDVEDDENGKQEEGTGQVVGKREGKRQEEVAVMAGKGTEKPLEAMEPSGSRDMDEKNSSSAAMAKPRMMVGVGVGDEGEGLEEVEMDLLDDSLRPDHRFFAVRTLLENGKYPRKLNRRLKFGEKTDEGFWRKEDERWYRNHNDNSIERRVNVSASFNGIGDCITCLEGTHPAWVGKDGQPVLVVAGDQHFPANLPAVGEGECIKVLRVENGSLAEITSELVRMVPRNGVVPGTVIMLGSAVQLGVESVAYYAAEWKRCRNWIKSAMGDVIVIPILHLSPLGIEDRTILRGLIDMAAWWDDMEEPELKLIRNTRLMFMEAVLGRKARGPGWADTHINSRMPVSLSGDSFGTTAFVTGDWGQRPEKIQPLSENGEKFWIGHLVGEVNREMRLGLATSVSFGRTLSSIKRIREDVGPITVVTVGASNAGKTAAAFKRKGVRVSSLGKPGWKVTEKEVDDLLHELSQSAAGAGILVLHCLDSSCFYVLEKDGSMSIPKVGSDGVYHITGKVVVARGPQLENLLDLLRPVLDDRKDLLTFVVSPLVRYLEACCNAHDFRSEEEKIAEGERQLRELGSLRRELKSWIVHNGYRNTFMVDPLSQVGAAASVAKAKEVMADTVHMTPSGYGLLASKILDMSRNWLLNKKRKADSYAGPEGKRIRMDTAQKGGIRSGGGKKSGYRSNTGT